jgi:hypothetical protein
MKLSNEEFVASNSILTTILDLSLKLDLLIGNPAWIVLTL